MAEDNTKPVEENPIMSIPVEGGTITPRLKTEEELLAENNTMNPDEIYMTLFGLYAPKFHQCVDNLPSNALRRIVKKLISYPLNEKEFKATSELEHTAFLIGDRVLEAKYALVLHTMMEKVVNDYNAKLEKEKISSSEENKTNSETNKETENG